MLGDLDLPGITISQLYSRSPVPSLPMFKKVSMELSGLRLKLKEVGFIFMSVHFRLISFCPGKPVTGTFRVVSSK